MKRDRPVSYRLDAGAQVAIWPFRDFDTLGPRVATFTPDDRVRLPEHPDGLFGELVIDGDALGTTVKLANESAWWLRWEEPACA